MKRQFHFLFVLMIGAFMIGYQVGRRPVPGPNDSEARRILYYVDPMNPAHTSARPGRAPCGMRMEPVYSDPGTGTTAATDEFATLPGTVRISPRQQQILGVQVAVVENKPLRHTIRLLGRVAADETRIYRINATVDGWITEALPFSAGSYAKKGETLATFYSPEFLSAGQALLFALASKDRIPAPAQESELQTDQASQFNLNVRQYTDSLKNLGMGDRQIEEMVRSRKFMESINVASPANGFVMVRNVSSGQRFDKGTELFRIVDLSKVWILADVFENEAGFVRPGLPVRVTQPNQVRAVAATISEALPQFDGLSRTLKIRLEADNPDFALKPEMFVDVELPVSHPETLILPADAVLDSGVRKTVFVERANGVFEPRNVETGWRFGDQVEIVRGLMAGERIAISGNFLLDSESRMKLAATSPVRAAARDPVCGMAVDEEHARVSGHNIEYKRQTYSFCGSTCQQRFDQNPDRFLNQPGRARAELPVAAGCSDSIIASP